MTILFETESKAKQVKLHPALILKICSTRRILGESQEHKISLLTLKAIKFLEVPFKQTFRTQSFKDEETGIKTEI